MKLFLPTIVCFNLLLLACQPKEKSTVLYNKILVLGNSITYHPPDPGKENSESLNNKPLQETIVLLQIILHNKGIQPSPNNIPRNCLFLNKIIIFFTKILIGISKTLYL
jgi:hypothetical protein